MYAKVGVNIYEPKLSPLLGLVLGLMILTISFIYSVTLGALEVPLGKVLASFVAFDGSYEHLVIQTVRLPRSLIAIFVGAALGVSGGLMQGLTRNPLAEPGILGITSGAALAVVIAFMDIIKTILGLDTGNPDHPFVIKNLRLPRTIVAFMVGVALAGAGVATAGTIGFVGLIAPHLGRQLVSGTHEGLIPTSALLGGMIVVLADLLGRSLFAPIELPCGVVTAAIGAPYFLFLLICNRKK